jgi:hypothetical protein
MDAEQGAVYDLLSTFFSEVYNMTDPSRGALPAIEHVLGLVGQCRSGVVPCLPGYDQGKLDNVWESLEDAIRESIEAFPPKAVEEYERFGKALNRIYPGLSGVHFISLNYDCLLDGAFKSGSGYDLDGKFVTGGPIDPEIKLDYGLELANYTLQDWVRCGDSMLGRARDGASYLLKPHGSLSLAYCPICGGAELFGYGYYSRMTDNNCYSIEFLSTAIKNGRAGCHNPKHVEATKGGEKLHHKLRPFIVPPSLFTGLASPPQAEVMACARELLTRESKFCFVGYSLPYTDFDIWQLLREAELKSGPKKVLVVDKLSRRCCAPGSDRQNRDTKERYRQVFGNIRYLPLDGGFAEFIDKMPECLAWFDKKPEETAGNEDA